MTVVTRPRSSVWLFCHCGRWGGAICMGGISSAGPWCKGVKIVGCCCLWWELVPFLNSSTGTLAVQNSMLRHCLSKRKVTSLFAFCVFVAAPPQKNPSGDHHGSCIVCVCSPCVSLKWFCCCLFLPRPYSPFQAGQGGGFSSVQLYAQRVSVGLPWHFSKLLWDVNRKEENKLITTVQQRDKNQSTLLLVIVKVVCFLIRHGKNYTTVWENLPFSEQMKKN